MRPLVTVILVGLLVCSAAVAFQQPDSAGPVAAASILSSRYCLGPPSPNLPMVRRNGRLEPIELYPPDSITLRLRMNVTYRNTASVPWILPVASQTVVLAGTGRDWVEVWRCKQADPFQPVFRRETARVKAFARLAAPGTVTRARATIGRQRRRCRLRC